jgi:ankyrin repeat protein
MECLLHYPATLTHHSIPVLLKHRMDINQRNISGETPVYLAAANKHFKVLKALIEHKADISIEDNNGTTSLHIATKNGYLKIVSYLLQQKINYLAVDHKNHSALYYALKNKNWDIVRAFIHVLKLDQINAEDKQLMMMYQKEIIWSYYLSANSSKKGETSPVMSMLMHSYF